MGSWLIGIGAAGFLISLWLQWMLGREDVRRHGRPAARAPGTLAMLGIAVAGAALAILSAWPAWLLGQFLGPYFEVSPAAGGAIFACIFGLGGAGLTGALHLVFRAGRGDGD